MGRRKIEIKTITNERNRSVTFLKRKNGLFKKAYELGVLCSVDVEVIIFGGPVGQKYKLFEYCSGDADKIVKKRLNFNGERDVKGPEDFGDKAKAGDGDDDDDVEDGGDDGDDNDDGGSDIVPPPPSKPSKSTKAAKAPVAAPSKKPSASQSRSNSNGGKKQKVKNEDIVDDGNDSSVPMELELPVSSRTPVIAAAAAYARSLAGERDPGGEPKPKRQRRDSSSTSNSSSRGPLPPHAYQTPYGHHLAAAAAAYNQSNDEGYPGGAYPGSSAHHPSLHNYPQSHDPTNPLSALSLLRSGSMSSGYPPASFGQSHSHGHGHGQPGMGMGRSPPMNVNINISRELMEAFALHQAQHGGSGGGAGSGAGPPFHSSSGAASAHTSGSYRSGAPHGLPHPPPPHTHPLGFDWPSATATPPPGPSSNYGGGGAGDHDTSWLDIFSNTSSNASAGSTNRSRGPADDLLPPQLPPQAGSELLELFGNLASLGSLAQNGAGRAGAPPPASVSPAPGSSSGDHLGDRKRRFDAL